MEDKGEVLYELSPKFDFLYELTMPTGKKMKSSFMAVVISLVITVVFEFLKSVAMDANNQNFLSIVKVLFVVGLVFLLFSILMFIVRIVMQSLEYKGIKYTFYKECLVYENNFLNQTKKTIEYSNIREIEIRRTLIDRILNYGVIIIYTNAEKGYGSATVIYAVKDIERHYNNIENIVHNGNVISSPIRSGDANVDFQNEVNLQNAMTRNENYNETTAASDVNPLDKNKD